MTAEPTIILTGATGYLGGFILPEVVNLSQDLIAIVRAEGKYEELRKVAKVIPFESLNNVNVPGDSSVIVNLMTCYGRSGESYTDIYEANVLSPICLYQWAELNQVKYFVNIDTNLPAEVSDYSSSKAALRDFLRLNSVSGKKPAVLNVRVGQFYGPGEDNGKFLKWLYDSLTTKGYVDLTQGDQVRDFLHVSDVVSGLLAILKARESFKVPFLEIPLGTGVGYSVRDFVEMVHSELDSKASLNFGAIPKRKHEPASLIADCTIMHNIGWKPKYNLESGIRQVLSTMSDGV